jgi:tetratricopeptide (TPR) repeat protein
VKWSLGIALPLLLSAWAAGQEQGFEAVLTGALAADREGRLSEAAAGYREAARLRPEIPHIHYQLSWTLLRQGLLTEALDTVEQALALDPEQASFHFLQGSIFRNLDNARRAEEAFENAVRLSPDSGEGYLALADLYQSGQQFEKAVGALRSYLALHPGDVQALYFLGTNLIYGNKMDEALEVLDRVIGLEPDHARAWFGKAHVEAQKPETMVAARVSYQKSLELDPSFGYCWYEYGTVLGKLGKAEEAVSAHQRALELDPELEEAEYGLGTLLARLGRSEEAKVHLDRFKAMRDRATRERESNRRAVAAFGRGRELLEANRVEEAIDAFLELTELSPQTDPGYAFLAKAYASLGQVPVAVGYVRRAMELSPGTSEYPYLLSLFLRSPRLAGSHSKGDHPRSAEQPLAQCTRRDLE